MQLSGFSRFSGIYAITDDTLLPAERLLTATEVALQNGVSLIQYRSKTASDTERLEQAKSLARLCEQYKIPLIINDDVELCRAAGASGVHLGHSDASVESARARLGSDAIIGVTCHASIEDAVKAENSGADYVAFGRFFPSNSKPQASPAKLEILGQAAAVLKIPIVAIGGINAENGASLLQAGADMLAVIHAVFGGDDVAGQCRELVEICELAKQSD